MRHAPVLVLLATTLGLSALNCGGDESTPPAGEGSSGTHGNTPSGAGMMNVNAGTGGTSPGAVASTGGRAGGASGYAGSTATSGGAPAAGAGGLGSGGAPSTAGQGPAAGGAPGAGAGAGGIGATTGGAGSAGAGQPGVLGGASGSAGSAAVGPCGAVTGATFAQVEAIITKSCGTTECHPNAMRMHTDLHNTDGQLRSRLLGNAPVSVKTECQNRPLVVPCSPETSLIMQKLGTNEDAWAGCGKRMPDDCPDERACLTAAEVETIRSWIAAGALPQSAAHAKSSRVTSANPLSV